MRRLPVLRPGLCLRRAQVSQSGRRADRHEIVGQRGDVDMCSRVAEVPRGTMEGSEFFVQVPLQSLLASGAVEDEPRLGSGSYTGPRQRVRREVNPIAGRTAAIPR